MIENVRRGQMVFLSEGSVGIGSVREVHGDRFMLYVENAGDFAVARKAILKVHDTKVILDPKKLSADLLDAAGHAHDREDPYIADR